MPQPTLSYATPRGYSPAFGGVPEVPDPTKTAKAAVTGTRQNWKDIKDLGSRFNRWTLGQYTGRVPGYTGMAEQSSENIAASLRGEVPQDVIDQLAQSSAERGIMRGVPGSQASNADYLRGLGLTSLGLQKYGEEALTGATHRLDQVKQFDPSMYFTSPEEMQAAQLSSNIYAAAPNPQAAYTRAKSDIASGSRTTPGLTYSNLTPSGGGVVPSPVTPTGGGVPVVGYGTRPDTTPAVSSPWTINPTTGQFSWSLPQGAQSGNQPMTEDEWWDTFGGGAYGMGAGGGTATNTMTDDEWWDTFGGGAYGDVDQYGYTPQDYTTDWDYYY